MGLNMLTSDMIGTNTQHIAAETNGRHLADDIYKSIFVEDSYFDSNFIKAC